MATKANQDQRRATMKDVACLAGVSLGTVSHVLNGSKRASHAATEAVHAAVAALDYRPNSLARSLIARRPAKASTSKARGPRLVTVGYLSIDYMVSVDAVPAAGTRMTSKGIEKMLGGPAANVAAFAAGLGKPLDVDVEIISHVGDDADSDWALEQLAERGIDASGTVRQRGRRLSRCIVLVDAQGGRTILNEPLQVPVDLVSRHLGKKDRTRAPSCVHFDGFHLATAEKVHDALRKAGHLVSMHSAGLDPDQTTPDDLAKLMGIFDLMVLDRAVFAAMTGDKTAGHADPEDLFALHPGSVCDTVVLTRGAEGAVILRRGQKAFRAPGHRAEVIDATGAGDALTGVFLGSWLAQGDPQSALVHAVSGASLSLGALGAQGRLPRADQIDPALVSAEMDA